MASRPSEKLTVATPTINLRDVVRTRVRREHHRIHWLTLGAAGMKAGERIHVPMDYDFIADIAIMIGCVRTFSASQADLLILSRPKEADLLSQISRLTKGRRIIVYNEESDIDSMPPRCFDIATACVFDRESRKVVRVFDPIDNGKRTYVGSYINVELMDINDSSLSIHASRIAALR